jgi:acetyl esterase/lipase
LRLYQPKLSKDLPVMLYLHGSGYVLGAWKAMMTSARNQ